MKKIALLLSAVLSISLFPTMSFAAGNTISSLSEFQEFRDSVNGGNTYEGQTVTLSSQVDLSSVSWTAIGTEEHPFKGTFDGNGNNVIGLNAKTEDMYCGLFGYNSGTIKNLNVKTSDSGLSQRFLIEQGVSKTSKHLFGGAVAAYNTGNITNCTAEGLVSGRNDYSYIALGGLCGMNKGTISGSSNTARVSADSYTDYTLLYGDAYAGGICAINEGFVTNSSSAAKELKDSTYEYIVSAPGVYASSRFSSAVAGGAIGDNRGTASDVTSSGYVWSNINFAVGGMSYSYAGGVCGSNTGTVIDSSSTAYVVAQHHADSDMKRLNYTMSGGIAGYNYGDITNSTFNGLLTGGTDCDSAIVAYTGGITGYNYGTVNNCEFASKAKITDIRIVSGYRWANRYSPDYIGGICGYNNKGFITRCTSNGKIYPRERFMNTRDKYIGGIVGENDGGTVSVSSSSAAVILDGDGAEIAKLLGKTDKDASTKAENSVVYAGSLAGLNNGKIENCYSYTTSNTSNVIKAYNAGGLAGINDGVLENCYFKGLIDKSLSTNAAGIAVKNNGTTSSCYFYNLKELSDSVEGAEKTLAEMMKADTYVNWPFELCWQLNKRVNGGLPSFVETDGKYGFSGGDGTAQSPYIIKTAADLYNIRFYKDCAYKIANDIEYTYAWNPMGSEADAFTGSVDGNFCTITFSSIEGNFGNAGFIGYGNGASVKNLNVKSKADVSVKGNKNSEIAYAGMIIAQGKNVNIENCTFDGKITVAAPFTFAGAVAGDVTGTIKGCRSFGSIVTGTADFKNMTVGGIVGKISGLISACEAANTITSGDVADMGFANVGGVAGIVQGKIENCCAKGNITNDSESTGAYIGGVAGLIDGDAAVSYSDLTLISPLLSAGGFAAKQYNGTMNEVYFNYETSSYNGLGDPVTSDDFIKDGFCADIFTANGDGDYLWTLDKTSGKLAILHVSPVWVLENGFTKCSFEANSDTCEIYYTTDGSNPVGSGTKYTEPFFCDAEDLQYYVVEGGKSTGIFSYQPSVKVFYPMQFTQMPTNQNGEAISKENIASATEVRVGFLSDEAVSGAKLYLALYDENDVLKSATCINADITTGQNNVKFENISADGAASMRIFMWNSSIVPYTPELKF